jgi:hypothetical protein
MSVASRVFFSNLTNPINVQRTMSTKSLFLVILLSVSFLKSSVLSQTEKKFKARDLFLSSETQAAPKEPGPRPKNTGKEPKATTPVPLGLRYSLLKQVRNNQVEEVDPDTVFRSGDRIRLSVESNDGGYLYVVQHGSSGRWNLLFPSKETPGGKNTIEKGDRHELPLGDHWFAFDKNPGIEQVYLVLSRKPEPDLEKLIQPSGDNREPAPSLEKATVKIRDQVATARDLVFDKVTEGEKAVYVVDPTGSTDSKVVVDFKLTHR